MAIGDIYVLRDFQSIQGQEVLNVYQYRQIASMGVDATFPTPAGRLQQNWRTQKLPAIVAAQATALEHRRIEVENLFADDDAYDYDYSAYGTYGGAGVDDLPSFNAVAIRQSTIGTVVRDGAKRLAGALETAQLDGVINDPTLVIRLNALATALNGAVTVGTIVQDPAFQPVVVKRIAFDVDGETHYRFPENTSELVYANIVSTVWKWLLSSQVSRKVRA